MLQNQAFTLSFIPGSRKFLFWPLISPTQSLKTLSCHVATRGQTAEVTHPKRMQDRRATAGSSMPLPILHTLPASPASPRSRPQETHILHRRLAGTWATSSHRMTKPFKFTNVRWTSSKFV